MPAELCPVLIEDASTKCPACKKGRLKPTVQRTWIRTDAKEQPYQESSGYQCDNPECGVLHAEVKASVGIKCVCQSQDSMRYLSAKEQEDRAPHKHRDQTNTVPSATQKEIEVSSPRKAKNT